MEDRRGFFKRVGSVLLAAPLLGLGKVIADPPTSPEPTPLWDWEPAGKTFHFDAEYRGAQKETAQDPEAPKGDLVITLDEEWLGGRLYVADGWGNTFHNCEIYRTGQLYPFSVDASQKYIVRVRKVGYIPFEMISVPPTCRLHVVAWEDH